MRSISLTALTAVAVLVVGVGSALATTVGSQARTVLHYGDSLAVGTGIYLPALLRGWSVSQSYDVSRHTDAAPPDLRSYGSALPRVVVVSLGANDSPATVAVFERQVREVLRIAGPDRCVIWSSIMRPPYNGVSYDALNGVLRRLDRQRSNLVVFDWARIAARHPAWFGSDGVHPTATGYKTRAAGIARLVRSDC